MVRSCSATWVTASCQRSSVVLQVSRGLRCGGGRVAVELGDEGGEWLAGRWGVW